MKSFLTVFLIIFAGTFQTNAAGTEVYEQDNEKVPVKEGYEPLDMSEYQAFDKQKPKSGKQKFSTSCRDITGKDFKPNEPGYETCLRQINPSGDGKKSPSNNLNLNFGSED